MSERMPNSFIIKEMFPNETDNSSLIILSSGQGEETAFTIFYGGHQLSLGKGGEIWKCTSEPQGVRLQPSTVHSTHAARLSLIHI